MDPIIEIIKYIVLGIVQGITEIFPISSSGHLTIFSRLLRIDLSHLQIFLMITNAGSFLALIFFFRKDVRDLTASTWKYLVKKEETSKEDYQYVLKLIIAVVPIGLMGLLIKDYLPDDLLSVGFALLITGSLLTYVYLVRDIQWKNDVSWKNAWIIGLFQMFALFSGISRSGVTITGGLVQKIDLKKVLRFSFLSYLIVSVPVTLLGIYELFYVSENIHLLGYSLAFIMSFLFSFLAVKFMYRYVKVKNLSYFAIYCFIVGVLSISLNYLI